MSHNLAHRCPHCGYAADAVSGVSGAEVPEPGDLSVCIECGEVLEFHHDLIRKFEAFSDLHPDTRAEIKFIQRAIRESGNVKGT